MRTLAALGFTCVVLGACAAQPRARSAREAHARAQGEPALHAITVALPPSTPRYDASGPSEGAVSGPGGAQIGDAIRQAGTDHGLSLVPDARLGQLAAWIADQRRAGDTLPNAAAMDLAARQLGLVEPLPTISLIATDRPETLPDHVYEETSSFFDDRAYTHFGGVVRDEPGAERCVLVLSQRFVALEPMPRSVAAGETLTVTGTLALGYASPELAITFPDGRVERSSPTSGNRIAFHHATREPGVYRVEILAEGTLGTTVVANFPLYVGVEPPSTAEVVDEPRIARGKEKLAMLELINDERTRAGVGPLTLDATLSQIAEAHSRDMQEHAFVGHTSPTTGGAPDRVARAGVRTSLVLENIGRGYSLAEVHAGLMASPGHRGNILHPQATNVGIGVATEAEHERTAYLITEVFTRVSEKLATGAAKRVLDAVNAARSAQHAPPLSADAGLTAIAQRAAQSYFADGPPTDAAIMAQVQKALAAHPSERPRRVGAVLTVVGAPEDLTSLPALANPAARALGVGLAQGERAGTFPNAICAVLLVAE